MDQRHRQGSTLLSCMAREAPPIAGCPCAESVPPARSPRRPRRRLGDYGGAVEDFSAAIALEPHNADFFHNRGFSLRKMVRLRSCWPSRDMLLAGGGGARHSAVQARARKLSAGPAQRCDRGASSALVHPMRRSPHPHAPTKAHTTDAPLHPTQERYRDAVADYTRALALNPAHVKAHYNRAVALERLGQAEAALADYVRVTELEPGNAAAHLNAGLLLAKLGRCAGGRAGGRLGPHVSRAGGWKVGWGRRVPAAKDGGAAEVQCGCLGDAGRRLALLVLPAMPNSKRRSRCPAALCLLCQA